MTRQDVDEFLNRVDEMTAPTCGACGETLTDDDESAYFCDAYCSDRWHATQVEPLTGYREPWNRPDVFPGLGGDDMSRWRPPGEFRLPRSTGDLRGDRAAAQEAYLEAITADQFAAVELRMESLREREAAAPKRPVDYGYAITTDPFSLLRYESWLSSSAAEWDNRRLAAYEVAAREIEHMMLRGRERLSSARESEIPLLRNRWLATSPDPSPPYTHTWVHDGARPSFTLVDEILHPNLWEAPPPSSTEPWLTDAIQAATLAYDEARDLIGEPDLSSVEPAT